MQSTNRGQCIRRVLLWAFPILALLSMITFTWIPRVLQYKNQAYEKAARRGWTIWLQEFYTGGYHSCGRLGDFAIDERGWIWVAVASLDGLHYYNGQQWTSREGSFGDLAIGPKGEVWAVHCILDGKSGVDIFDGQQWRNFNSVDLGLADDPANQQVLQVEFSSDGRIWAVIDLGQNKLAEIIPQEQGYVIINTEIALSRFSSIKSLDADNDGSVWFVVWAEPWVSEEDDPEWTPGLYTYDGESWQRLPDAGVDLSRVIRTRFDDQGNAWVITEEGAVMTFNGEEWTTIVTAESSPVTKSGSNKGLFLDGQNRIWLWQNDSVHLLENETWKSFTDLNSGFAKPPDDYANIFGVIGVLIDYRDRLWIASTAGVSMIPVEGIEPLKADVVNQRRMVISILKRMNGTNWYLPVVLILLWLAAFQNSLPGVLVAAAAGIILTYLFGAPYIDEGGGYYVVNLGVFVTFGGMAGGLIGGQIDKFRKTLEKSNRYMNIIFAIGGLVVGFIIGFIVGVD